MPADRSGLHVKAALSLGAFRLDVTFDVGEGETVVLVGPNGAGKSSCIGIVTGLFRPDSGTIAMSGETWFDAGAGIDLPPRDRRVGLVHQDYALFPHLTVAGNIAYGPRARGADREGALRSARQWLERLGIESLSERRVSEISGGQRQRVALARALASGARVLLLDEPFGSLDVSARAQIRGELRDFLRAVRLPALVVTQDAADALALADRIAVLENGILTQTGTRGELLSRPGTRFVADLFGLNYVRAELEAGSGLREAHAGSAVFHVLSSEAGGAVSLAFPPSVVALSAGPPGGSSQNSLQGAVIEVLPLSDRMRVVLDCGVIVAADVTHEAAAALGIAPGRTIWASVKATAIRVYP